MHWNKTHSVKRAQRLSKQIKSGNIYFESTSACAKFFKTNISTIRIYLKLKKPYKGNPLEYITRQEYFDALKLSNQEDSGIIVPRTELFKLS